MHHERRPNPDRSPDDLEGRLRSLRRPPVPAALEVRLLAAIPAGRTIPRRFWVVGGGLVAAVAAACVLVALAWRGHDDNHPVPTPPTSRSAHAVTPQPRDESTPSAAWRDARSVLEESELPAFNWPIKETVPVMVSTKIPPDLFD
jgi:hypothetical protein